jgi:hypothetical protein
MSPALIGIIVFACTFGGALAGMRLRVLLPEHHVSQESRESVKAGIGLIATMTALVLGIVTGSAKSSFDEMDSAVKTVSADLIALDRALARYGTETAALRATLRDGVMERMQQIWPPHQLYPAMPDLSQKPAGIEGLTAQIQRLEPGTQEQRALHARAVELAEALLQMRWLIFENMRTDVPVPFLVILCFWLTITFASFGLFAPRNATVNSALFVSAVSVAGAVFLVLEMNGPFEGLIRVSPEPIRYALAHMSQ